MGSEELADNIFRITQADSKLKRDNVINEYEANLTHYEIGKKENECAQYIASELKRLGYNFMSDSVTNQIFPIVNKKTMEYLEKEFLFEVWEYISDDEIVIRFVTSFTTRKYHCDQLIDYLKKMK